MTQNIILSTTIHTRTTRYVSTHTLGVIRGRSSSSRTTNGNSNRRGGRLIYLSDKGGLGTTYSCIVHCSVAGWEQRSNWMNEWKDRKGDKLQLNFLPLFVQLQWIIIGMRERGRERTAVFLFINTMAESSFPCIARCCLTSVHYFPRGLWTDGNVKWLSWSACSYVT